MAATAQTSDTFIINASGAEQRSFNTPFAVTVVGAEELRSAGAMVNLSEALARVPGLVVGNRSNAAQDLRINSRGFGARASFGVRGLRSYSDGIPARGPDGQGQVSNFDLAGAARIEVLRGPFSALQGNSSGVSSRSSAPRPLSGACRSMSMPAATACASRASRWPRRLKAASTSAPRFRAGPPTARARKAAPSARWARWAWVGSSRKTAWCWS